MNENIAQLKKYNLWGSNTFDWEYIRNEYTGKIIFKHQAKQAK